MRFDLAIFSIDQSTECRSPRNRGPEHSEGFSADEYKNYGKKENVIRTYQCIDGHCPIAGGLRGMRDGRSDWNCAAKSCILLTRRKTSRPAAFPGSSALFFLEGAVPMAEDGNFGSASTDRILLQPCKPVQPLQAANHLLKDRHFPN